MSAQTRTITVPQDVSFVRCDGPYCVENYPAAGNAPDGWMKIRQPQQFDTADFCSYHCLAKWAHQQALDEEQKQVS